MRNERRYLRSIWCARAAFRIPDFAFRFSLFAFLFVLASPSHASSLRIATFNVYWLTANAEESRLAPWTSEEELAVHRRNIARILAEHVQADLVTLQEVTSRAALEKLLEEPALRDMGYRLFHVESADTFTGQDVAFLVGPRIRLDPLEGDTIARFADTLPGRPAGVPRDDPRRQRLTKHAMVCVREPGPGICLLGVHLLAGPDDSARMARRETQARIITHLVRTEILPRGYAPIVLGDFNARDPDVPGTRGYGQEHRQAMRIIKDYDPDRPGNEMFNGVKRKAPSLPRHSAYWDRNRNGRWDEGEPVSLIDHILLDSTLAGRVVRVEILHEAHDGSVSDHWPVVVEINEK